MKRDQKVRTLVTQFCNCDHIVCCYWGKLNHFVFIRAFHHAQILYVGALIGVQSSLQPHHE